MRQRAGGEARCARGDRASGVAAQMPLFVKFIANTRPEKFFRITARFSLDRNIGVPPKGRESGDFRYELREFFSRFRLPENQIPDHEF